MQNEQKILSDGTIGFLPHRLNRQPVVVRGLTADELWFATGASGIVGLLAGIPPAMLSGQVGMVPTAILLVITLGIFGGGGMLRRWKRGRPDTWLNRQIQWQIRRRYPVLADILGVSNLISRSGRWSTRRNTRQESQ